MYKNVLHETLSLQIFQKMYIKKNVASLVIKKRLGISLRS